MALPPSTANWHWKNKDVTKWAKGWFEKELPTVSVSSDSGETVTITGVTEVDGDVELGQRKSKMITIFDCKVVLSWQGTTATGTEVNGILTLLDVSHEVTVDRSGNYEYQWTKNGPSSEGDTLYQFARSKLPSVLEAKLAEFPAAIINTHGKDIYISAESSRVGTPAPGNGSSATSTAFKAGAAMPIKKAAEKKSVNLTTVEVEASFQADAKTLYGLLTTPDGIRSWSRDGNAQSNPVPNGEYSLFGGNVQGKYESLTPDKKIVQTWQLKSNPEWSEGHFAILTTTLDESSSTDSTKVTFSLAGVPINTQDAIRGNIEGYYVNGFKSIGYAHLILTEPVYSSSHNHNSTRSKAKNGATTRSSSPSSSSSYMPAIIIASLVLAAAFAVPYLSSSPVSPPK